MITFSLSVVLYCPPNLKVAHVHAHAHKVPKGARLGRDRQTMRSLLAAATLIPAGASAYVLSAARTPVALRATSPMMTVESWYDQGTRLSGDQGSQPVVELPADNGMRIGVPAGMSESAAAASPQLAKKALAYELEISEMQARIDAFPKKEGTMYGACLPHAGTPA